MITLTADVRVLRADNPGPMTLDGTNTWVLGAPDEPVWIVDPGPPLPDHLDALATVGPVAGIVLTHRHLDHAEAAPELARRVGCGVWAGDPALRIGDHPLVDGDRLTPSLEVLATPGHTSDSTSLLHTSLDGTVRLLTGDMVLGRGTTVIMHPDGDLADYFSSLERYAAAVAERDVRAILPGHGPVLTDPAAVLGFYRRHRRERLDQVRAARAAGATTAEEVVERVYADVDRSVWPAATASVRAQLAYLDRSHIEH